MKYEAQCLPGRGELAAFTITYAIWKTWRTQRDDRTMKNNRTYNMHVPTDAALIQRTAFLLLTPVFCPLDSLLQHLGQRL